MSDQQRTYTRIPWTNDNGLVAGIDREHENCPSFDIFDIAEWQGPEDEGSANAQLIAAAPDLLAALEGTIDDDMDMVKWASRVKAARAAINKARGVSK